MKSTRTSRWASVWLLAWLSCSAAPNTQAGSQRVLLLHSFGRDFAPFAAAVEGLRSELSRSHSRPVEFFEASLQLARFDGEQREEPLVTYLESAFAEAPPGLIVAFGAPALDFVARNRAKLFPDVPVLSTGAEKRRVEPRFREPWLAVVHTDLDLSAFVKSIRDLLPGLRQLYVVSGTAPVDRFWETQARREWPAALPRVTIHWMSDKSIDEIETELSDLPQDSAVFYGIMTRDAAGNFQEYETALERVRHAASAPVFGYSMEQFGSGIVGGSLISMRECGFQAAQVAQRILARENPADIAPIAVKPSQPTYDWRELRTWNIPRSRLPQDHLLMHRPPTLWESHRTAVLLAMTALIVLSAGLLALAEARRRARDSEARLRPTTEAAHVGLWEAEGTGAEIVHLSTEWRAMFGFPDHGEVTSGKTFQRIHADDVEMVRNVTDHAIANGESFEIEFRIVRDDGSIRWIATRGRAEPANNGRRGRMRGVAIDITERKRAEHELALRRDELARLGRVAALGQLSGALAHELNQPLGSIMSNAQTAQRLLARESGDTTALREILADIVAEDQRAADIIQRLRDLLERGETRIRPLDIHDCIKNALSLMQAGLKARGVTVTSEFAESPPLVMADPVQIQQVFLNLLGNAADAVTTHPDTDRRITIRTVAADGELAVEVEDHGGGFSLQPEECFQAFRTTKPGGLGMGLAICRSIIEAHQGDISVISPPAGGARVRFTLPTTPHS